MDAAELLKEFHRFCKSQESCSECELQSKEDKGCILDMDEYFEKAVRSVQIVKQWAKDHPEKPVKTRQGEFLKKFPDAKIGNDGVLIIYPCAIEKRLSGKKCGGIFCNDCRREYWLEEY